MSQIFPERENISKTSQSSSWLTSTSKEERESKLSWLTDSALFHSPIQTYLQVLNSHPLRDIREKWQGFGTNKQASKQI